MLYNSVIRSRAPLRISFAGGGTDIKEYANKYGGAVTSATIGKYAYTTLKPNESSRNFRIIQESMNIDYSGTLDGLSENSQDIRFFNGITRHFSPKSGFELNTHTDVRYGSGLGASSTMIVSLVGAFDRWLNLQMDQYEVAKTAYKIERVDLGIEGGMQDQYAAAFGGFNFIEFKKGKNGEDGDVVVNQMRLKQATIDELQFRLLMVHTGATRNSGDIIHKQKATMSKEETIEHYRELSKLAVEIKDSLYRDKLSDFGSLLAEEWEHKKMLSAGITNKSVDKLFEIANASGSLGGKLLGAGGGGYALFFTDENGRYKLTKTLQDSGYETSNVEFTKSGLESWIVKKV